MRTTTRHCAFTLIELLTVISIIGILMSFIFAGSTAALTATRRAKAAAAVRNIAHSVRAYSLDYGKYPPVAAASGPDENQVIIVGEKAALATESNAGLFNVLRSIPIGKNENHALNPRRQRYYEDAVAKSSRPVRAGFADGTVFAPEIAGCYFDPWGWQYTIVMDADGDDTLDLGLLYSDLAGPGNVVRQNPAVLSLAADGIRGAKGYEGLSQKAGGSTPPDDLFSWR